MRNLLYNSVDYDLKKDIGKLNIITQSYDNTVKRPTWFNFPEGGYNRNMVYSSNSKDSRQSPK